ncbi:MAG TPA: hypothetical protein VK541_04050 [Pedobacter sp.]|uniref:hypothetical protein n=1 Tax=Pedobacter sp. TaxID=1411316 RepID=UPI002B524636|nr:hypothetical protein [Pedobacter sp.]HMI01627.1 hypothetical protein [Pedobacter sp.]
MSGKLLLQARKDAIKFVSAGGFEEDILIKTKDETIELAVKGLTSGHTQIFDNDGNGVISTSFHIDVPEQFFIEADFPYINPRSGKIDLKGYKVFSPDNTQAVRHYVVNETHPNATTGLIICILGRAE